MGGIESLVLDERRYFFGFDYSADLVVSPLIDDAAAMAAFAAAHMRQRTGEHDASYWAELVEAAVASSALTDADAHREFTSAALHEELPDPGGHLLYLLGAATGWADWFAASPEATAAAARLKLDTEDPAFLDECLAVLAGQGVDDSPDEWLVARFHLTETVRHLPGNWAELFAPLAAGLAEEE
ncbi:hypothetical protein Afil01_23400 [Actinorhabdospora filicis]|uniref:Uncharacterized protein n=1 Tax=Actinorhabdospora filicis TaxID=1785913 RepID=A0A9W6SK94_9ACTN|nr:hypothetical protein Afil01_23400 [Actinorhabdospora filicis]